MRYLLSGGGTGGHINPAVAIANKIKSHEPNAEFLFIGAPYGLEKTLVPKEGYDIRFVKVRGFSRKLSLSNIDALIKAVTSVAAAKKIIKEFAPDAVIGTGGYASWAALKAASALKIPTVIHEQNAFPGVTTKMLSKHVGRVCISFHESEKYFDPAVKDKLVFTGNPIKSSKFTYDRQQARKALGIDEQTVYIMSCGGSLGADMVNSLCFELMNSFVKNTPSCRQIHATGHIGWDKYSALAAQEGLDKCPNINITEYIYDMPLQMAASDIVICRAGAITLAELAFLGRPAILIPSPNVAEDHQYKNAKVLADAGAAIVMRESEWSGEKLVKAVKELWCDSAKRNTYSSNIRKFASPDADEKIYSIIKEQIKSKTN
ncbi:MAG TPA: undecaprenyldiphospho-muramoylpentapeptide beta-N-acetylglucosaminyltransferase [Bacillota bacterium]|nr:undecaprenyldiphospho-muramoylpentapeptide beta-N-acetylglucosaminyltransferase [Bacillota bacterium]